MNHFSLRRLIGKGGMGVVYEAESVLDGGGSYPVAIKVMDGSSADRERYEQLFQQEALTNLRIGHTHPGLVTVFGYFGHLDGSPCMVMELVRGCDLRALLRAHKVLSVDVALYIAEKMLDALDCIHTAGYLHRDLSPGNILLSEKGDVKVSDLGLAKELLDGSAMTNRFWGKPAYASPEALRKEKLDPRSDMFSFGAIMYEMVMGRAPYGRREDLTELAKQLKNWNVPSMDGVPTELIALIGGLFHDSPDERRPQTARDALRLVRSLRSGEASDDSADDNSRGQLATMVTPLYQREQAKSKLQSPIPLGSIQTPVVLQVVADPTADTDAQSADDTRSGTADSQPIVPSDEASLSGLSRSDSPTEHLDSSSAKTIESGRATLSREPEAPKTPRPRRYTTVIAIAVALVLGFAAQRLYDLAIGQGEKQNAETSMVVNVAEQRETAPAIVEPPSDVTDSSEPPRQSLDKPKTTKPTKAKGKPRSAPRRRIKPSQPSDAQAPSEQDPEECGPDDFCLLSGEPTEQPAHYQEDER